MEVLQGANLVVMSLFFLDVCHFSWLIKIKIKIGNEKYITNASEIMTISQQYKLESKLYPFTLKIGGLTIELTLLEQLRTQILLILKIRISKPIDN